MILKTFQAQDSLQQHADDFKGADGLTVYIVTPDRSSKALTGIPYYPAKVPAMAQTVATILGISKEEVKIKTYIPVDKKKDKSDSLTQTAAGHMIFDFDPDEGSRRGGFYAWRIIWENSQIAADLWEQPSV